MTVWSRKKHLWYSNDGSLGDGSTTVSKVLKKKVEDERTLRLTIRRSNLEYIFDDILEKQQSTILACSEKNLRTKTPTEDELIVLGSPKLATDFLEKEITDLEKSELMKNLYFSV